MAKPKGTVYVIMKRESTIPHAWAGSKKAVSKEIGIAYSALCKAFTSTGRYVGKEYAVYLAHKCEIKQKPVI